MGEGIQIIAAPSILGLKSEGVEKLPEKLLACGLKQKLQAKPDVIAVATLNDDRNEIRDTDSHCLNTIAIRSFSMQLGKAVSAIIDANHFAFVLGGDCSILLGIMPALKAKGSYGLFFIDAHADFYEPEKSTTGEVADMDLAIITGRGPEPLTNINGLKPYVLDKNVIHISQRDEKQTEEYGSQDLRDTAITCFSLQSIRDKGMSLTVNDILQHMSGLDVKGFWIHFDTDVLADEINPAVDYRLPGGLQFEEAEMLIKSLLRTGKIAGISVTIYNANLDPDGSIAEGITNCLSKAFDPAMA
jgi:arginase